MATHFDSSGQIVTLADLLTRLGGISPERVLAQPPPGTATDADVIAAEGAERKRLCELIDGVLVEKAPGFMESVVAATLTSRISAFVSRHSLGLVTGAGGMFRLSHGQVRIPDVAFVSWQRLPGGRVPHDPIPDLAPELAAEVLSPGNTPAEMARKRRDYFAARVRLVWEIEPRERLARTYIAPQQFDVVLSAEILAGGDVLPGFELPLADLFAQFD